MLYRHHYLQSRYTLGDSGTLVFDINIQDPISALMFEFRATNGATSNKAVTMADCVSAIEVIDGSDVLLSLTGHEAFALAAYLWKNIPYQLISEIPGNIQNLAVLLPFGRFLGDQQYALDPKKFVNPQVRVKWNLAAIRAVGATGFVTATGALTVVAMVQEGGSAPIGFISHKEIYTYTTGTGKEYIDIPADAPIRGILFRADLAAYAISGVVNNLKLNCDAGKFIAFDMRMTDLVRYLAANHPPFLYKHYLALAGGDTAYLVLKQDEGVNFTGEVADEVINYTNNGYGEGVVTVYVAGSTSAGIRNIVANVQGYCPYRSLYLPFGDPQNPSDWFPAQSYKRIQIEAQGAVASGSAAVVLSQLRNY